MTARPLLAAVASVGVLGAAGVGAKSCSDKDCAKLAIAVEAACAAGSSGACEAARKAYAENCTVAPTPTPPPPTTTTTTVPAPPPTTLPPPPPTTLPPPTPSSACPKALDPGARVYMRANYYGQGLDSTVRVAGDVAFCEAIHHVPVADCHLEGWPRRAECEMELLGGCPIWQWRNPAHPEPQPALQENDDESGQSADHFGSVEFRDDPKTPEFEGRPRQCGDQRDHRGHPMAGFFCVMHGDGEGRACRPDGRECSDWKRVVH